MNFGEKLKSLRIKNEYSQETLAEMINVSRQAVTKWENGNGMPDIENLKLIADIFDVTIDSLVRDEEEIDTLDESFCFNFALYTGIIFFCIGFLLNSFLDAVDIIFFPIIGGIIGYIIGYLIIKVKNKK
ncbi:MULTISPECIES: helix-turn-helix domain-containing protein [Anaerofustis]|uniref:helix-turn-helix domain-containing protein n=1 Tax=Anaerofustis TaxID=264995 RepID=UPI001A9A7B59|nr:MULTISPECIES: helix-turn-helix transcriptional regulator [Anaerofustis]MCO8194154.1 helix-turn-helix domain-containing protein [Anaerofustis sp. NSJ-163]